MTLPKRGAGWQTRCGPMEGSSLGASEEAARRLAQQVEVLARAGAWDQARREITVAQLQAIEEARPQRPLRDLAIRELLELPIAELGLETRTVNHLEAAGLIYLRQLIDLNFDQLRALRGIGELRARQIFRELETLGFDCSGGLSRLERAAGGQYWKPRRAEHGD